MSGTKSFAAAFGAAIALVLLLLYTGTIFFMIWNIATKTSNITEGMVFVVTTVGGLVSALVVSQLAVTQPGENPTTKLLSADASQRAKSIANVVSIIYLAVWGITGLAALIIGVMLYPNANTTLRDAGTTWLGLAVAAGYAYFGIQPRK